MKDFDQERALRSANDREFRIGGRVFTRLASVRPEVLFEYEDMPADVGAADAMRIMDDTLKKFLEGDDAAAQYDAMRAQEEDAVTVNDLAALLQWLIAESTGRPTVRPLRSTDGPVPTRATTPSTDDSPLPEPVAAG